MHTPFSKLQLGKRYINPVTFFSIKEGAKIDSPLFKGE